MVAAEPQIAKESAQTALANLFVMISSNDAALYFVLYYALGV